MTMPVAPATAAELSQAAHRVRDRVRDSIIGVGHELIAIKARVEHGQFRTWVETECQLSIATAERAMNAARWAEGKSSRLTILPPAAIYLLSAPTIPTPVHDEIIAEIEAGKPVKVEDVRHRVSEARKAARKAARRAKKSPEERAAIARAEARQARAVEKANREYAEKEAQRERATAELVELLVASIEDHECLLLLLEQANAPLLYWQLKRRLSPDREPPRAAVDWALS